MNKNAVNNLIKTLCDSAANSSKTTTQKVEAILNEYKMEEQEKDTLEMLLDQDYTENIKMKRTESELSYQNYLDERTILYDQYKEDNNEESLRRLLNFHIKSMKELNNSIQYSNIYTKYGNIRNVL